MVKTADMTVVRKMFSVCCIQTRSWKVECGRKRRTSTGDNRDLEGIVEPKPIQECGGCSRGVDCSQHAQPHPGEESTTDCPWCPAPLEPERPKVC